MARILICGDSFAADWTKKYPGQGWPNLLSTEFDVTNLAQAGCSEYKIWLQLDSVLDRISEFDHVVISHTSPYRIYVKQHPVHYNDVLHHSSDLIYSDIIEQNNEYKNLDVIVSWFENYFDLEHAKFVHNLICEKIDNTLKAHTDNVLHIAHMEWNDLYQFDDMLNFKLLFDKHRGSINHYDQTGNQEVFTKIMQKLNPTKI